MLKIYSLLVLGIWIHSCEIPLDNRWTPHEMVSQGVRYQIQELESDRSNYLGINLFVPKGLFKSQFIYLMCELDCERPHAFTVNFGVKNQDLNFSVNVEKTNLDKSRFVFCFSKSSDDINNPESVQKIVPIVDLMKYSSEVDGNLER